MSDQNQILRLLGTIREECSEIRSRQEELYELLLSYKDQIQDLKETVVDKLSGLPKSPYVAGQLVPAPEKVDGIEDLQQLLATYLHRYTEDSDAPPEDVEVPPPAPVKPEEIELEPDERDKGRPKRSKGGEKRRPRDTDLERGPDRDIEPIDLSDDGDDDEEGEGKGKRRRRRRSRGGRGKSEKSAEKAASKAEKGDE